MGHQSCNRADVGGAELRPDRFDVAAFLRDDWQQRPALIRNPWRNWASPMDPDELAGLACEEGIEARLIEHARAGRTTEHGPFTATRLAKLGRRPWTLLVQAVDHHVPMVADLIQPFRFVPDWRIDDVMVSCAGDGGGVGPHFDQYDVFLIQGSGRRRWRVGGMCDAAAPLAPGEDLRILADFAPVHDWLLEPGDILYVPPGFAHDGVAVGDDCMTYSIGFRAPSRGELIANWSDHLLDGAQGDDHQANRYRDTALDPGANPGEITARATADLHAMVTQALLDREAFARWFGCYTTEPKYADVDWSLDPPITMAALRRRLAAGTTLERNPATRVSFIHQGDGGSIVLFVDGEAFDCDGALAAFAQRLAAASRIAVGPDERSPQVAALLLRLVNAGSLAFV